MADEKTTAAETPKKKTTTRKPAAKKTTTTAAKTTNGAKASTDEKKTSAPKKTKKEGATTMETFMEHQKQALAEARKALESLMPTGLKEHSAAAFNESLEGYRKLVNSMIDEVKANAEKVRGKVGRGEKAKKAESKQS